MSKSFIQQKIKACSSPDRAAAIISFSMVHRHHTASQEELQRRRDDLALIIKAASPSRAADQIVEYMSNRQLIFLGSSNLEPLQRLSKKATARILKACGTKAWFKTKAS